MARPPNPLGSLVHERRRGNAAISATMAVLGGALTLYGFYYLATTFQVDISGRSVFLVPGSLLLLFGTWAFVNRIRLYERGIDQRTFFGTRSLTYDEVEILEYAAARILIAGVEAGTRLWVTLRPARGRAIVFDLTVRDRVDPIEGLRDQVASTIATRWLGEVQRGGAVRWGSSARLTAEGLVYRPSRLIGRGPETLLRYSPELRWGIAQGRLAIVEGDKAVTTLECREPNFYPGLAVFSQLVSAARRVPSSIAAASSH